MKGMARWLALCGIASLALTGCSQNITAQPAPAEPRSITTTGEAEVRVAPDQVVITLGVQTDFGNLDYSKEMNDTAVGKIVTAAKASGVTDSQIQTEYISIRPPNSYYSSGNLYRVQRTVTVTLNDLSKFEKLLTDVVQGGYTTLFSVDFRLTDLRKYRDQARSMAINAAKEKAQALAGELDQTVGRPLSVQEQYSRSYSWYGFGWGYTSSGSQNVSTNSGTTTQAEGSVTAPRQISVTASVTVKFELK